MLEYVKYDAKTFFPLQSFSKGATVYVLGSVVSRLRRSYGVCRACHLLFASSFEKWIPDTGSLALDRSGVKVMCLLKEFLHLVDDFE